MIKPQGRRGEVSAELHTDFPERFAQRRRLFALDPAGTRRELELEEFWKHKGRMILKFRGVDSISAAEALVGCEIQIPDSERAPLEPGSAYIADLLGCTLVEASSGREIGRIEDVQFGAGEAPLLVIAAGNKEFLVPFAMEFTRAFEPERKRVVMALPEGMLDLDAPLTDEEKKWQRGK